MLPVIILFAKAPMPGRVKTRLVPPLRPDTAALLYTAFVRDTLESLLSLAMIVDVELHTDIETDAWADIAVPRSLQDEGDLGLKMLNALKAALHRGHAQALILGSDSPDLPPVHLQTLLLLDADIALGPADDGGYYAIVARRIHPDMFAGVGWSTPDTLQNTVDACAACGLTTALGPAWFDIDDAVDLERLRNSACIPRNTARVLDDNSLLNYVNRSGVLIKRHRKTSL
jgi:uncharacterized protein